jgi:hypothetical protein
MTGKNDDVLAALNPADYFTLAMDEEIRQDGMPGSLCGFALELDKTPDVEQLQQRVAEFIRRFPLSQSCLQQRGKRFFWCARATNRAVFFQHQCPATENAADFQQAKLEAILNQHEPRDQVAPIEFHLLGGGGINCFLIRWIHPFCDARSAELIFKYLCTDDKNQRQLFDLPKTKALINVQLDKFKWWQKIGLFFKAKAHIENIDKLQSILPFDTEQQKQAQQLHFVSKRLTVEQTQQVAKQIRQHVGITGTSLYYLGCMMRALEKLNPALDGEAYCVPYAFNLRKNKALSPVLGNHVGALFAQAPRELVSDRAALFAHLKQQNKDAIRQQIDYAFMPLMWAGSWLSLEKYGKVLRQSFTTGEERSSFWFSDIGQPDLSTQTFFGAVITDLIYLCQISSPPALAVLSCQYQLRLTLTYNYMEPFFSLTWIDQLHAIMLKELLGE